MSLYMYVVNSLLILYSKVIDQFLLVKKQFNMIYYFVRFLNKYISCDSKGCLTVCVSVALQSTFYSEGSGMGPQPSQGNLTTAL